MNMQQCTSEREKMLWKIHCISFMVDDIKLFLDTHPNDTAALECFEKYRAARVKLLKEYATRFGPLTVDEAACEKHWKWVDCPWPWQLEV